MGARAFLLWTGAYGHAHSDEVDSTDRQMVVRNSVKYSWISPSFRRFIKVGLGILDFGAIRRGLISKIRLPHPIWVAVANALWGVETANAER